MKKIAFLALALLVGVGGYFVWVLSQEETYKGPIKVAGTSVRAAYLVPNPGAPKVTVYVIFQSGELENDGPEGLAHYLEHLSWLHAIKGGTSTAGRHANAWTSGGTTAYYLEGEKQKFAQTVETVLRVTQVPDLNRNFATQERDIVQREFDFRIADDPYAPVYDDMRRTLFAETPYARSVLGTPEEIDTFTVEAALALHAKTHRLEDAIVIVHGDVTPQRVKLVLGEGDETGQAVTLPALPREALDDRRDMAIDVASPTLFYHRIAKQPSCGHSDECYIVLYVLDDVLNGLSPGGLAGPLRFDNFIARSFNVGVNGTGPDGQSLWFSAEPDSGVDLPTLEAAFEAELAQLIENGVPPETFQKVKERLIDRHDDDYLSSGPMLDRLIAELSSRVDVTDFPRNLASAQNVTLEQVNAALAAFGGDGRVVVRRVSPIQ